MTDYYDRRGRAITQSESFRLRENPEYKRVAETTLPNGWWVSTVWLTIDHRWDETGQPIIFETMVFESSESATEADHPVGTTRYCTEDEALAGHLRIVMQLQAEIAAGTINRLVDDDAGEQTR